MLALRLVRLEYGPVGEAALDVMDLPGEVLCIKEGRVHTLAGFGLCMGQ